MCSTPAVLRALHPATLTVNVGVTPGLCQSQLGLSVVLKDAAGNFTAAAPLTVNLNGAD